MDRYNWPLWVLGLALVLTIVVVIQVYPIYASVDAQLDRSQVSSNMKTMAENLEMTRAEMERRGITHGYSAIIFKSPQNNVGLDYEAIISLRDRATELSEKDPTSIEYNVGMDDIRGTAREIEINAWYWVTIRSFLYWITIAAWIAGVYGVYTA